MHAHYVTHHDQGGSQARGVRLLDASSSKCDTSWASSVDNESPHGSSESNLIDAENHELDNRVHPQKLAVSALCACTVNTHGKA
ncbi:hypothetical protein WJX79_000932 [Trebouxia sp. C0005]